MQKAIAHLGYVQIDTISVVQRAHHHVLWSRVPNYQPAMLARLLAEKKVFEYWFHAASYLPIEDYRYALPRMQSIKSGEKHWFANTSKKLMREISQRIEAEGALMARDFADPETKQKGWWEWKPAKQALEQLFIQGDLMVVERQGFQKKFDLTSRVLPDHIDTSVPSIEEQARHLVEVTIRAHGYATAKSFTYLRKGAALRRAVNDVLQQLITDGQLIESALGCGTVVYCDAQMPCKARGTDRVAILSPFDNSVIQRERCDKIFDFDYQIECYVPQAKRKYGYFCLPLLHKDKFIGRMDCKADRKLSLLRINALYFEEAPKDVALHGLAKSIRDFMQFNDCESVQIDRVLPAKYKVPLKKLVEKIACV